MFLRNSNLVPDTMDTFNQQYQFCRQDINVLGLNKAMMCEVRWSKTIQFKQRILWLPVLPADNKAICPVFWTHLMISCIPGTLQDPLFMINAGNIKLALSANQLIYRFRKWLKLIGQDSSILHPHYIHSEGGCNICLPIQYGGRDDKAIRRLGKQYI